MKACFLKLEGGKIIGNNGSLQRKGKSLEAIDTYEQSPKTSEKFNWDHGLVEEKLGGTLPVLGDTFRVCSKQKESRKAKHRIPSRHGDILAR